MKRRFLFALVIGLLVVVVSVGSYFIIVDRSESSEEVEDTSLELADIDSADADLPEGEAVSRNEQEEAVNYPASEETPEDVASAYSEAIINKDCQSMVDLMAFPEADKKFLINDCMTSIGDSSAVAYEIEGSTIDGNTAEVEVCVTYHYSDGDVEALGETMYLGIVEGKWMVGFGPIT
jgi:hypothetical protein